MSDLITVTTMATWCQVDVATLAADSFATDVRKRVSDYVRHVAGHPEWTLEDVPTDVANIVLWMCRRTYLNPDQEVSSNVGPLGSRVLDDAAMAMMLTEAERAVLEGYSTSLAESDGLWTLSLSGAGYIKEPTIYAMDSGGSDWMIPFLDPMDVNSPDAPGNLP